MKRAPTVLTLTLPCSAAFWRLYVPYFGTNVVRDELEPILRVRAAIRAKNSSIDSTCSRMHGRYRIIFNDDHKKYIGRQILLRPSVVTEETRSPTNSQPNSASQFQSSAQRPYHTITQMIHTYTYRYMFMHMHHWNVCLYVCMDGCMVIYMYESDIHIGHTYICIPTFLVHSLHINTHL